MSPLRITTPCFVFSPVIFVVFYNSFSGPGTCFVGRIDKRPAPPAQSERLGRTSRFPMYMSRRHKPHATTPPLPTDDPTNFKAGQIDGHRCRAQKYKPDCPSARHRFDYLPTGARTRSPEVGRAADYLGRFHPVNQTPDKGVDLWPLYTPRLILFHASSSTG